MPDGKRWNISGVVTASIALVASGYAIAQLVSDREGNRREVSKLEEKIEILDRRLVNVSARFEKIKQVEKDIWTLEKMYSQQTTKLMRYLDESEDLIEKNSNEIDALENKIENISSR